MRKTMQHMCNEIRRGAIRVRRWECLHYVKGSSANTTGRHRPSVRYLQWESAGHAAAAEYSTIW